MKNEIAEGNPYESEYLLQLAEQAKKKREDSLNKEKADSAPLPRKQVEVTKMDFSGSGSPSVEHLKGCGKCQQEGSFPGCPGFSGETFR